ncbi:hypothetical protein MPH_10132 [Macrophomina phaseolina MS6]|uniref:Uncharacterized protein n=1 Tax=Macrophomina phaseolina (strain MS6) TaxID=1126212 RepID=K2RR84_MACPH|nr:hypothetical protein MPH_10132 [Macrophomina phaseolina MS6]
MSARYVSSQLIKNIQKGTKSVAVEYVDKTTSWTRPDEFPASSVKSDFTQVAEENLESLKPETVRVAMNLEHQSDKDKRMHYSAYELDKDGNVIGTRHFVKQK